MGLMDYIHGDSPHLMELRNENFLLSQRVGQLTDELTQAEQTISELQDVTNQIASILHNMERGSCRDVPLQCSTPGEAKELVTDKRGTVEDFISDFASGHYSIKELREGIESVMKELETEIEEKVDDVRQACEDLRDIASKRHDIIKEIDRAF